MKYETLWHRLSGIYDTDEAKAIVRWMLGIRFGLSLTDIVCGKLDEMTEAECETLEAMMLRLEAGEPVQYVVGTAEFCGRRFHVEPGVLIPRPETGELCEWIVASDQHGLTRTNDSATEKAVRESPRLSDANILDVGTGSGCIAITLALEMPQAKVTAWDISDDALRIAKKNAEALGAEVTFEQRDALNHGDRHSDLRCATIIEPVPMIHPVPMIQQWDAIVSNPPYVCQKEAATMERHVLEHEPHLALFVPDDDPLRFYRAIAKYGQKTLKPNGLLYFELNPLYAYDTESMVRELGYAETEIKLDMFGKQRFLKAFNKG
jgi:release factor glutamine methyltransferase